MKYLLLLSFFISSSVFAIDFNKVTGTFEVEEQAPAMSEDSVAAAAYGTFNFNADHTRAPASAEEETQKSAPGINDVTGTFQ